MKQQDEHLVDQIVAGVLARLGQPTSVVQAVPVTSGAETPTNKRELAATVWNENVITSDLINERLKGNITQAGVVYIGKRTVLTPSALDVLRARGVSWKRVSDGTKQAVAVASQTWKMILQQVTPQVQSVLEELRTIGPVTWTQEIAGTVEEGIVMAVTPLCRAEVAGVMLLTDRPHAAACLANRNAALRAAVVKELADVESLKRELGPNMYCLSPQGWGGFALKKVIMACVDGEPPTAPASWKT